MSIGTLYNRFGTREALIDVAAPVIAADHPGRLAAEAQAQPDPWARFVFYVTALVELQATSPPVDDIMARRYPESEQLEHQCDVAMRHATRFIEEAQAAGSLRADFAPADLLTLFHASSAVARDNAWRRHLGFLLDGLRAHCASKS